MLAGCATPDVRAPSPLLEARDACLAVSVDAVIVPNSFYSWTRNAYWDEYRMRVRAAGNCDPRISRIRLFDALGRPIESSADRGALVDASEAIEEEYLKNKVPVSLLGPNTTAKIVLVSVAVLVNPVGAIINAPFVIADTLAKNAQVSSELGSRQTRLPVAVDGSNGRVVAFFPRVPHPSALEISYIDGDDVRSITIPTHVPLYSLHGPEPRPQVYFPAEAARRGFYEGHVKARLSVDTQGAVSRVDIIEASSPFFVQEATRTFAIYKYGPGDDERAFEEVIHFTRRTHIVRRGE
jgi:hypothetical protein